VDSNEYIQIIIGAKAGAHTLAFFYVLAVYDCIYTVSRAGLHGSKRLMRNRLTAKRRFLMTQKTVYDLKLLVIFLKKSVMFLKKSVMFFKKLVMFYQSLAAPCCFPVYPLIIYKTALDKICLIHDVKGRICKISSLSAIIILTTGYERRKIIFVFIQFRKQ